MFRDLLVEKMGSVTTITLNRPGKVNALSIALSHELRQAVLDVRDDPACRVMVLTGAGGNFCAGDDISEFPHWGDRPERFRRARLYQETAQMIEDLEPITVAAVDGYCCGGGVELTLVCDFVIATERSRWGMPEIDIDITPGWGGTQRMARFTGRRKAKEINLIGALYSARRAEEMSLVNRVVSDGQLTTEVKTLVDLMLLRNPHALRKTKFVLNKGADTHLGSAMGFEALAALAPVQDAQGVAAFNEKNDLWHRRRAAAVTFWQD